MTDKVPFFDFFDRFLPPRELRLLLHDAAVTGGVLDRDNRAMELEIQCGEMLPGAAQETVRQLLMQEYDLRQLRLTVHTPQSSEKKSGGDVLMGKPIKGKAIPMVDLNPKMGVIVVEGKVFSAELRETRRPGQWCLTFDMTDYAGSVTVRRYMDEKEAKPLTGLINPGMWLRVQGTIELTRDGKDVQLRPQNIAKTVHEGRKDTSPEKRVELHLHTRMSNMDALTDTASVIKQAVAWGHPAIAITDHGVVQSFPEAFGAAKKAGIKLIPGCEGYLIDDAADIVKGADREEIASSAYVVLDVETTGLNIHTDSIIEIGAVRFENGDRKSVV